MSTTLDPVVSYPHLEAPALSTKEKRIPELDGVRGLAILFVLLFHYASFNVTAHSPLHYALLPVRMMWSGVDLFFVLSGFLIGGILVDHKNSPGYFITFYARRFHRIIPVYYILCVILIIGTLVWPDGLLFKSVMPVWAYPLFLQNVLSPVYRVFGPPLVGVTWSIAIEEQFYLILPLIVRLASGRQLLKIVIGCILFAPLLRAIMILSGAPFEGVHALLPARADDLALGVLAAIIFRTVSISSWIKANAWALYCVAGVALAVMIALVKWANWKLVSSFGYSVYAIFYFCFILSVLLLPNPRLKRVLNQPWLRWLGTTSYCIYLVHEGVRYALFDAFGLQPVITNMFSLSVCLAALTLTLAIAHISWVVVERPLMRRAHARFKY